MKVTSQREKPPSGSKRLKRMLTVFLPLFVLVNSVMLAHYWIYTTSAREQLEESQKLGVELSRKVVADELAFVISEVNYLADDLRQRGLSAPHNGSLAEAVGRFLITFAGHRPWYDHIRYLDPAGNELVRINNHQSRPQQVAEENLQNKSNRYYFPGLKALKPGQIYISPLDLNIEGNKVEMPPKPTVRVGIALYGSHGEVAGYLLVNYLGNQLINDFKLASTHISEQMMLINDQGYWLISPDEQQNWGFILNHEQSFSQSFMREWKTIQEFPAGQFDSEHGLFTFSTVYPYSTGLVEALVDLNPEARNYYWKVVSFASQDLLNKPRYEFLRTNGISYSFTLLVALLSALMISRVRQRHEAVLIQNTWESSFRRILENIQMAAVTLDHRGRIIFCNDYFQSLSDYPKEELLDRDWVNFLPDDENRSGLYTRFLEDLTHHRLEDTSEGEIVTRDGQRLLLSWNNTYSLDENDNVISVTLLGRDITQQRDIEEQLIKLSQAVEQSPNTVMITNARGDIEYVNPRFCQLTGYQPEEVLGHKPSLLKSGQTDPEEYQQLWSTISQGQTWHGTLKNKKKNGDLYWEKTVISPIMDGSNRIRHFLSVKEDITERVKLTREVERQTEETRKNRELAAVGQMANMVAHDLRNPLSSIKMAMQILSKDQPRDDSSRDNQTRELISISQDQIRYMEAILNDLMSFSRPGKINPEWLRADKLMATTIIGLQKEIRASHIEVVEQYQKGLPTIYADPVKLRQVFSNLLINAIQAVRASEQPKIIVSMSLLMTDVGLKMQIGVTDNGSGLDPCQASIVFEPFYTSKAKGTGLGLAIVKQNVEQHRGSIQLAATSQGGARATLILPINPE